MYIRLNNFVDQPPPPTIVSIEDEGMGSVTIK